MGAGSPGSADWDITLASNVVANCPQQIERLLMKMQMNVAMAFCRADESLADAQAWMRAESNFGTMSSGAQTRRPNDNLASGSDAGLKMCMYGHGEPCDSLCTLWGCKSEWCQFWAKPGRTAQHRNEKSSESAGQKTES
jgi:hypothetical protein